MRGRRAEIVEVSAGSEDAFVTAARDAEALYAKGMPITKRIIDGLEQCRIIAHGTVGVPPDNNRHRYRRQGTALRPLQAARAPHSQTGPPKACPAILTAGYGWVARVACGSRDRKSLN